MTNGLLTGKERSFLIWCCPVVNRFSRVILILALLSFNVAILQLLNGVNAQGSPHVLLNEFDPMPISGLQWAELFNPTSSSIDIGGWSLVTTGYFGPQVYAIPSGVMIPPQGYYVIEFPPYFLEVTDSMILRDLSINQVDRTPLLTKNVRDGNAWARFPNGFNTGLESDWRLQLATKGYANSYVGPAITCLVSSSQVETGSTIRIFGEIGPPRTTQIIIQTIMPNAADWSNLTTVTTTPEGTYEHINYFLSTLLGTIQVRAYLPGDAIYPPSFSPTTFVTVTKIVTGLSAAITHPSISLTKEIATYGQLTPSMGGVNLTLTYRKPTGNPVIRYILTDSAGFYNDTSFKPMEAGNWNVTVDWQGDQTHFPASSYLQSFQVIAPGIPSFAGTEWIFGAVVGVTIGVILMAAAVTRKTGKPKPPRRAILCPVCRLPIVYDPTTNRWYCPQCRQYIAQAIPAATR